MYYAIFLNIFIYIYTTYCRFTLYIYTCIYIYIYVICGQVRCGVAIWFGFKGISRQRGAGGIGLGSLGGGFAVKIHPGWVRLSIWVFATLVPLSLLLSDLTSTSRSVKFFFSLTLSTIYLNTHWVESFLSLPASKTRHNTPSVKFPQSQTPRAGLPSPLHPQSIPGGP